jgi:hypothetical protein
MKLPQWTESGACLSGGHCAACRSRGAGGASFRAGLLRDGWPLPDGAPDFECPHGRPWGYVSPAPEAVPASPAPAYRVGEMLKSILEWFGIRDAAGCGCNTLASAMDRNGPAWCWANRGRIVAHMEQEAARRHVGFSRPVALALLVTTVVAVWVMVEMDQMMRGPRTAGDGRRPTTAINRLGGWVKGIFGREDH